MKCPNCGYIDSRVIDSRPTEEGTSIRRRRECISCSRRFTTYENIETVPLMVIKKDLGRQPFDKTKIMNGIIKACEKRPVTHLQIQTVTDSITHILHNKYEGECSSREIGELVMDQLKDLDEVAYVRFASVYREFKDLSTFMSELRDIMDKK